MQLIGSPQPPIHKITHPPIIDNVHSPVLSHLTDQLVIQGRARTGAGKRAFPQNVQTSHGEHLNTLCTQKSKRIIHALHQRINIHVGAYDVITPAVNTHQVRLQLKSRGQLLIHDLIH